MLDLVWETYRSYQENESRASSCHTAENLGLVLVLSLVTENFCQICVAKAAKHSLKLAAGLSFS